MDPLYMVLIGVVVPGALALAVVGGAHLVRPSWASRLAGLALAAGYALTFALVLGWPELPPVDVTRVTPWVALAAVPLGFVSGRWRTLATGVLGLAVGAFLAAPAHDGGALIAHAALVGLAFAAIELGLGLVVARTDPRGGSIATLVLLSGAATALLFSDTASLAQILGGLAAGVGALMTLGFLRPRLADLTHATPVIASVAATNLFAVTHYASGSYEVLGLIALAPLALGLVLGRLPQREGRLAKLALPAALIALPIAVAGVLAARTYFAPPAPAPSPDAAGSGEASDADYGY